MRSPLVTGLFHPLNLAMLGLAGFAGLVTAWWLFPLGLLLWLGMVVAVSRDRSLRFSHEMHRRAPIAQRFQRTFDRIERAQVSVFNSLASAPGRTRKALQPVQDELEALTNQAHRLCRRMTALENYRLVSESTSNLQAELQQIDAAIEEAGDLLVKQQYEESRRALLERIAKLRLVASDPGRGPASGTGQRDGRRRHRSDPLAGLRAGGSGETSAGPRGQTPRASGAPGPVGTRSRGSVDRRCHAPRTIAAQARTLEARLLAGQVAPSHHWADAALLAG